MTAWTVFDKHRKNERGGDLTGSSFPLTKETEQGLLVEAIFLPGGLQERERARKRITLRRSYFWAEQLDGGKRGAEGAAAS